MDKTTLTYLNSVELNEMLSPLIEKRKWKQIRDILNTVSIDKDDIDTRCDTVIAMGEFINSEQLTGSKAYQASIYLTLSELAGLVNANDGMFINEKFLAYNSLSYKHNDFAKNFNSYPTKPLLAFDLEQILAKNKLSKKKLACIRLPARVRAGPGSNPKF